MTMAMPKLIQKAREQLAELTGLELGSTVSANREENVWKVQIEVVEKKSLPDSMDILATYEMTMDEDANVVDFTRRGMRNRIDMATTSTESEV